MSEIQVKLTDWMGSDLKVVQMARDSFGKSSDWEYCDPQPVSPHEFVDAREKGYEPRGPQGQWVRLSEADGRLISMLARGMGQAEYYGLIEEISNSNSYADIERLMWKFRNTPTHTAPFGHCFATFKFQAPVFVMRQIVKHKFIRLSELSMRYVRDMPEYYRPKSWRSVANDVKQGSGGDHWDQWYWSDAIDSAFRDDCEYYQFAIDDGLAPEQARMFLRLCHMTQGHMSGSLDAWANLCKLRLDSHAQEESRQFAKQVDEQMQDKFPQAWSALMEGVSRG